MQCAERSRVQAYFDGEVDALSAADIERHAERCPECRALLDDLEQTRTLIRRDLEYGRAPPELRERIARLLDQETVATPRRPDLRGPPAWRARPFWMGATGGIGAALAATVAFFFLSPAATDPLLDTLVAAHVRSLMPAHLTDVLSADQHTVKPWFAGHADVSPVVADFSPEGYRLVGGRADYFDGQRVAVAVYAHGPHVINVFTWAGTRRSFPNAATRNGYHILFWKVGDLEYCAVSDAGWEELQGLVRLLRGLSVRDAP
ncbi:MAG: anti-sigma factor family protein, partial [Steroidobacteraceae bacterium]